MTNPIHPEPSGMSTQKKWLIGCGGCLAVLLVIAVAVSVLANLGMNALKNVSNQSVGNIFGKTFNPAPYTAMGLPLGQKNLKNMVLLLNRPRGVMIFAVDTTLSATDAKLLESGDPKQVEAFLRRMSAEVTHRGNSSGSSHLRDIRFNVTQTVALTNGKRLPISKATMEAEKRGAIVYSPTTAAVIPEENHQLVALIAMNPNSNSPEPDTDFSHEQADLQTEILRIVSSSALADRLISTKPSAGQSTAHP
jgi:hypothetical protein